MKRRIEEARNLVVPHDKSWFKSTVIRDFTDHEIREPRKIRISPFGLLEFACEIRDSVIEIAPTLENEKLKRISLKNHFRGRP